MNLVEPKEIAAAVQPLIHDALVRFLNTLADTRAHLPDEIAGALRKTLDGMKVEISFPKDRGQKTEGT